jgi:predicted SpoU family rRNA methylase
MDLQRIAICVGVAARVRTHILEAERALGQALELARESGDPEVVAAVERVIRHAGAFHAAAAQMALVGENTLGAAGVLSGGTENKPDPDPKP